MFLGLFIPRFSASNGFQGWQRCLSRWGRDLIGQVADLPSPYIVLSLFCCLTEEVPAETDLSWDSVTKVIDILT